MLHPILWCVELSVTLVRKSELQAILTLHLKNLASIVTCVLQQHGADADKHCSVQSHRLLRYGCAPNLG